MRSTRFTPFDELDELLGDLTRSVRGILGDTFVGAYLQGSFALGAGDLHSDCDFVVAATRLPSGATEAALRRLHDGIPLRPGHWTRHLEGSYADTASLRDVGGLGTPWLFNNHGHRELTWDTHCNSAHARWILRHHGITLAGPPVTEVVDEVPPGAVRAEARTELPGLLDSIRTWASFDLAWTQRYTVTTYCRMLYSLSTGQVASKPGALAWGAAELAPEWRLLLTQVSEDRGRGWDPADPPRPGSLEAAYAFAAYAESFAGRSAATG